MVAHIRGYPSLGSSRPYSSLNHILRRYKQLGPMEGPDLLPLVRGISYYMRHSIGFITIELKSSL